MMAPPTTNPLLTRLKQNARWPSLQVTLLLTIGLSLVSTLLAAYWLSCTEDLLAAEVAAREAHPYGAMQVQAMVWQLFDPLPPTLGTFLRLPGALLILTPITIIVAAIAVTTREIRDKEAYQQLRLALPPRGIVHGLMFVTLHRVRILLLLTFVLAPFLVIAPYQRAQAVARYGGRYIFLTPKQMDDAHARMSENSWFPDVSSFECADASNGRFFLEAIYGAAKSIVESWGMSLLGLALAVGLTLWWRKGWPVLLFFVVLVCATTLVGPKIGPSTGWCVVTCTHLAVWPPRTIDFLWLPIPYGLAWGFTLLARQWA